VLHRRYKLALVTNAADSGEALVRAALRRVSLDEFFDVVLTARELGMRKPDPAFFTLAVHVLGCRPAEAVMVGDDYDVDVLGACRAGLRAVWFNPEHRPRPAAPADYSEVNGLPDLPAAIERLDRSAGGVCPQQT